MKCYNCGRFLPDDSEFCQYCGKRIEKELPIEENAVEEVIVTEGTVEIIENDLSNTESVTSEEMLDEAIKTQAEETVDKFEKNKKEKKPKIRFCKLCGGQIESETKKCCGCGKQYFKGIKFNKFLITVLALSAAILVSVILNIVQFKINIDQSKKANTLNADKAYYMKKVTNQQSVITSLETEIKKRDEKIDFFDEHVVFVVDDGTMLYHKYDCYKFEGDFWAYNTKAAESMGYSECSACSWY